jgi:hypothetical protein
MIRDSIAANGVCPNAGHRNCIGHYNLAAMSAKKTKTWEPLFGITVQRAYQLLRVSTSWLGA